MRFEIEPNNGAPIFEQLVRQIKFAVAEGILVPGQMISSTRDLAKQLAINPNTVQRAFAQLQGENVLEVQRGRGVSVCVDAKKHCVSQRRELLGERMAAVIQEAINSGLGAEQITSLFEQNLKRLSR